MKRAEKYALARLMFKWGYYGDSGQLPLISEYTDVHQVVTVLFNDVLGCLQVPRSELDIIADKIKLVEVKVNG